MRSEARDDSTGDQLTGPGWFPVHLPARRDSTQHQPAPAFSTIHNQPTAEPGQPSATWHSAPEIHTLRRRHRE
ncbi:hypothetical protein AMIS_45630 [Actinoplanes missouriensis 431]|uniref:Uncharacterized protein n=1 Tax=Actinoplanes missouriensis (strain ATCC 14538 / DSM 43046 / CBS 188.64 / JCM 3121 / NBRC 102363 / NCIMB 12654 / NRRL B-3342 / UNCC 431) TaxID=512565 RepID=I0H9U6_ACTM4|nr:hypothetical protein AMIS_45630 [Actinoplanes missouriensis 431]